MTQLALSGVTKRFGATVAVDEISLEVGRGEFLCLLGPTNAGKTTLLKLVAGLHRLDAGSVSIAGRDVTEIDPAERRVSLLFQNLALFPDRNGFDNIAFPLLRAGLSDDEVRRRVGEVAELLRVAHLLDRLPGAYSGGERQRVAIGRAIARPSELLLLDEPLSNLDARIRLDLRVEFRRLHRLLGQTVIWVTHDQIEALSLADRIAVLKGGRLQQVAAPDSIYERPVNQFVARFIGAPPMNLIPARPVRGENGLLQLQTSGFRIGFPAGVDPNQLPAALGVGVRPNRVRVAALAAAETPFCAQVRRREDHGAHVVVDLASGDDIISAIVSPNHPASREDMVWFGFTPQVEHLLDLDRDQFLTTRRI